MDARDARSVYLNPLLGESGVVNVPHIKMNADEGLFTSLRNVQNSRASARSVVPNCNFTTDLTCAFAASGASCFMPSRQR